MCSVNSWTISVIDPASHSGKLRVPLELTLETKGKREWVRTNGRPRKDLSVCCLFQQGRCNAGSRCHQVHIERAFVTRWRSEHAADVTCCYQCGDSASRESSFMTEFVASTRTVTFGESRDTVTLPVERLALTHGLTNLLSEEEGACVRLPLSRVCRLHLKSKCKYGKDCKNVHACFEMAPKLMEGMTCEEGKIPEDARRPDSGVVESRCFIGAEEQSVTEYREVPFVSRGGEQQCWSESSSASKGSKPRVAPSLVTLTPRAQRDDGVSESFSCGSSATDLPHTDCLSDFCRMWQNPPSSPSTVLVRLCDDLLLFAGVE